MSTVVTKDALFGHYLGYYFYKYCPIWNQNHGICEFNKFGRKTMMSKVVTKNALFGHFLGWRLYFWPKIPSLGGFEKKIHEKSFSYIKLPRSNLSNCKFWENNEYA